MKNNGKKNKSGKESANTVTTPIDVKNSQTIARVKSFVTIQPPKAIFYRFHRAEEKYGRKGK